MHIGVDMGGTKLEAVTLDGSGSSDPDVADSLSFAWDLDGDGMFDDSTAEMPQVVFTESGNVTVGLRVTDPGALSSTDQIVIGAHRPAVSDFLLGPNTARIVRHAECSVNVVRN